MRSRAAEVPGLGELFFLVGLLDYIRLVCWGGCRAVLFRQCRAVAVFACLSGVSCKLAREVFDEPGP